MNVRKSFAGLALAGVALVGVGACSTQSSAAAITVDENACEIAPPSEYGFGGGGGIVPSGVAQNVPEGTSVPIVVMFYWDRMLIGETLIYDDGKDHIVRHLVTPPRTAHKADACYLRLASTPVGAVTPTTVTPSTTVPVDPNSETPCGEYVPGVCEP